MCGIGGEIKFNGDSVNPEPLRAMSEWMTPRGPDASGEFFEGPMGFCHRRLSIIDLAERSKQPLVFKDIGLVIVFNGEIYNYKELQKELKNKGHEFQTESDTEVLARGFYEWGDRIMDRLHGMYGFAIYNQKSQELFCGRDRLGIKPFYYTKNSEGFRFASSLPALLKAGDVDTHINKKALHHYMSLHSIVPAPDTILTGIHKLPPAHTLRVSAKGEFKTKCYWHPTYGQDPERSSWQEEHWEEAVEEALKTAVKRRLVADVPVGLFLSGGTDSSLIAALMKETGYDPLHTFSVGFGGAGGEEGNEFKYSDLVAEHHHTIHHKIEVSTEEILEHLPRCIARMNEPMVSHDNIGFYLLSKFASEHVKVVQSGQGADEVFAGYHWYQKLEKEPPENAVDAYAQFFFDRPHSELSDVLEEGYQLPESPSYAYVKEAFAKNPQLAAVDQALQMDTHTMLVDDPVKRVDSNTMAWSLEARVPFLDHELIELVARMPSKYKTPDEGKYLLKKIARRHVPKEVIDRPKGYFPVPQLKYIEGPFKDFVEDLLGSQKAKARGIFKKDYVEKLLNSPKDHITSLGGSKLWQIASLEAWLQQQGL